MVLICLFVEENERKKKSIIDSAPFGRLENVT